MKNNIVIIGSGVSGMSAIESIRSENKTVNIILIGNEKSRYYSRPGLAYYLSNELTEKYLFPFDEKKHRDLNYQWINSIVINVDVNKKFLQLKNGEKIYYGKLLLAVGATANMPNIEGIDLDGVVKFDSLADTKSIIKKAKKAKSAVVIGGGITSLEIAEGLNARKVKTKYFLRGKRYWGNVLDQTESKIIEARFKKEGIQIEYQTEILKIIGKKGKVIAVETTNNQIFKASIVGIAIGIRPRIGLAKKIGLHVERGILVNDYMETSEPDIYAAGDVAQVYDPLTGKSVLDSLWDPARNQGWIAGKNMIGNRLKYVKPPAFNVTRLAGLTTTIIGMVGINNNENDYFGIVRGDSESWRYVPDAVASQSNFDVNHIRLMIGEKTILGAIIMGNQTPSTIIRELIVEQTDISAIKTQLQKNDAPINEIITNFFENRRQNVI